MISGLPRFVPGFRLTDGTELNQLVDAINSLQANWFVGGTNANNNNSGTTPFGGFATLAYALSKASSGQTIGILPGGYDEAVTISRSLAGVTLLGMGGPGSIAFAPSAVNASGITNNSDNLTLVNVGAAGNGTGSGLVNTGSRLALIGGKYENDDGTGISVALNVGTVAQRAAGTAGGGADCRLIGAELCWSATGLRVAGSDYGAVTQVLVQGCRFHNLATAHIAEAVGSGGSAAVTFRNLEIQNCLFDRMEDGTEPGKYILLNASNSNSGIAAGNQFPTALAGGKNLVSTALLWVSNFHTGGVSGAQPS